jgi:hypothetical protein
MTGNGPVNVNASLVNIAWTAIVNGVETSISSDTAGYQLTLSGPDNGRITISKNGTPGNSTTMKFHAEYKDPRTAQVYTIEDTHLLTCDTAAAPIPHLTLTAPTTSVYNPTRDVSKMTITASLILGGNGECPASQRIFVWEASRDGSNWYEIGENILDYCFALSTDGVTLTVERELMGNIIYVRCRAKYSAAGTPSSVTLDEAAPSAQCTLRRRIPKFDVEITGSPDNLPEGALSTYVEAVAQDAKGVIQDFENMLMALWYMATNTSDTATGTKTLVAHGQKVTLSTSMLSTAYGATLTLDVQDRGGKKAWTDSDGLIITDSDGSIILFN